MESSGNTAKVEKVKKTEKMERVGRADRMGRGGRGETTAAPPSWASRGLPGSAGFPSGCLSALLSLFPFHPRTFA